MSGRPSCRFCGAALDQVFVDLGETPPSNAFLSHAELARPEKRYPLRVLVCGDCFLVQVEEAVPPQEIFSADYAYFSSFSETWLAHAEAFAKAAIARFDLTAQSRVVEVAANDGYLLRHFLAAGIPVLGVEPTANTAAAAQALGIPMALCFFNRETARELRDGGHAADLIVANNVLAHVPDINDFVAGFPLLLEPDGALSIEVPHLLRLMEGVEFDTIYHEHYSYFSLLTVERILQAHGLRVFDVEELSTHGGSLRVFACHDGSANYGDGEGLRKVRRDEAAAGLDKLSSYRDFAARVPRVKEAFVGFLRQAKADGKQVAAYGAAAKGNTLLNACAIDGDLIAYLVDRNPYKQGRFAPGSHLPVFSPDKLAETRPDYVVILPWNLEAEIVAQNAVIRSWGGRFVVPLPDLRILD